MTHHDYIYKLGLNTIDKFINKDECKEGGFYLVDEIDVANYLDYGENIAQISLPDDTLIYLEENKIKVNKLILENILNKNTYFDNLDIQNQLKLIKKDGYLIKYITNPDKSVQVEAVKQNGYSIYHNVNPDQSFQLEAFKQNSILI